MAGTTADFGPADDHPGLITLLLVQPDTDEPTELFETLGPIVERYTPLVRLCVMSEVPEELERRFPRSTAPMVLVIRNGVIIGEAMGTRLPARELDRGRTSILGHRCPNRDNVGQRDEAAGCPLRTSKHMRRWSSSVRHDPRA